MLFIDPVEGFWIAVLIIAFGVTFAGLIDALDNRRAVRLLNGYARELASDGTVRREALRLVVQALLLIVVIPGLFVDRPIQLVVNGQLNIPLLALILVPVVLLSATVADSRDRRRMTVVTAAELVTERDSAIRQLLDAIAENTAISQEASQHADAAFREANSVNQKIAAQGERIDSMGGEHLATTVETTPAEVHDIHVATVENHDA